MTGNDLKSPNKVSDPSTWIDKFGDYLFSYAMSRLNNSTTAEDVVQETFLAALKAKDNFAGASSEQTLFVGILKNKMVDYIRKVSRETDLENYDTIGEQNDSDFIDSGQMAGSWVPQRRPADWKIDSQDIVEKKEFWKFLHFCLSALPKKMAMIFKLRELEEEKPEIICNDLKISPTNLRVIMYRARSQMRIGVRFHLVFCKWCRLFSKQMVQLRTTIKIKSLAIKDELEKPNFKLSATSRTNSKNRWKKTISLFVSPKLNNLFL